MNYDYLSFQLPSRYWQATYELRLKVFVEEQGVPEELELDEFDSTALHFIALDHEQIVGTLRLVFQDDYAKLGRLAVSADYRHQGIATQLMTKAKQYCQQSGISQIKLGAQVTAKGFYSRLGYIEQGDIFPDAGIPHIMMIKKL